MVAAYSLKPIAQDTEYLKSVWETITPTSCPRHYNFHLHTVASDGRLTPVELMQQAIANGLSGLAITDHHTVQGYRVAAKYLENLVSQDADRQLPYLWTGVEITAKLLGVEVHILGYGFDPDHPVIEQYLQGEKPAGLNAEAQIVINSLQQAGGLVVLAHPERYRRCGNKLIPAIAALGIDGVETYYAYANPKVWQPTPGKTEQVKALASKYGLFSTCGTDTHGSNILHRL